MFFCCWCCSLCSRRSFLLYWIQSVSNTFGGNDQIQGAQKAQHRAHAHTRKYTTFKLTLSVKIYSDDFIIFVVFIKPFTFVTTRPFGRHGRNDVVAIDAIYAGTNAPNKSVWSRSRPSAVPSHIRCICYMYVYSIFVNLCITNLNLLPFNGLSNGRPHIRRTFDMGRTQLTFILISQKKTDFVDSDEIRETKRTEQEEEEQSKFIHINRPVPIGRGARETRDRAIEGEKKKSCFFRMR